MATDVHKGVSSTVLQNADEHVLNLGVLRPGQGGIVHHVVGPLRTSRRLTEMGFTPGTAVDVVRVAPLGDPVEVTVRGYHLSLRADQARLIHMGGKPGAILPAPERATSTAAPPLPVNRDIIVALAGNPNSGKTTLFNAITGLRQKVANYPGVTVDKKEGRAPLGHDRWAQMIDLPGVYSLTPSSPDERITVEVLAGVRPDTPTPDVIIAVVDATNLSRNILLVTQLIDSGLPVVVALTMMDEARSRACAPDPQALMSYLGVPVIAVVAATGEGLVALRAGCEQARVVTSAPWQKYEIAQTVEGLIPHVHHYAKKNGRTLSIEQARFLAWHIVSDGDILDGIGQEGRQQLLMAVQDIRGDGSLVLGDLAARYAWIDAVITPTTPKHLGRDGIDRVLLHRVWGLAIFALVMWGLFISIFTLASPLMDAATAGVEWLGAMIGKYLGEGLLHDLWQDGIIAGVGGVVVFIPQIAFMFILLSLLEESGYLARGAFLLDRLLSSVGLHGRSFVPLLSSHACAIPGIMSARTISDPSERLATILVAPFMSCSARLPVYGLLIGAFFGHLAGWQQGSILFALYGAGIVAAGIVSWVLRRTVLKKGSSSFLIELPTYRLPSIGEVIRVTLRAVWAFTCRAGTIIMVLSILLWAAMTFPRLPTEQAEKIIAAHGTTAEAVAACIDGDTAAQTAALSVRQAALEYSLAGRVGHVIEPVLRPLGMDWQIGIGLVGAFAAREVFVSTMGIVYGVGAVDDDTKPLEERMMAAKRADGSPVWTPLLAVVVLVWFVLAMQCISTVAIMVRETGGWRWPLLQLVGMNVLAWVTSCIIWQVGSRSWW